MRPSYRRRGRRDMKACLEGEAQPVVPGKRLPTSSGQCMLGQPAPSFTRLASRPRDRGAVSPHLCIAFPFVAIPPFQLAIQGTGWQRKPIQEEPTQGTVSATGTNLPHPHTAHAAGDNRRLSAEVWVVMSKTHASRSHYAKRQRGLPLAGALVSEPMLERC